VESLIKLKFTVAVFQIQREVSTVTQCKSWKAVYTRLKKWATFIFMITSATVDRFSYFFHC